VVEAGKDVLVSVYRLGPGASAGWHTHPDVIGVILKGTFSYYEGHDGKCVPSGKFTKGQAWFVKSHEGHGHLGVNEEDEPLEVLAIYFNVPERYKAVPVLGNQMDTLDFSPMPPADCPRLRDKNL
jgi:quercetin dioxygenase-like cupin family protein